MHDGVTGARWLDAVTQDFACVAKPPIGSGVARRLRAAYGRASASRTDLHEPPEIFRLEARIGGHTLGNLRKCEG